MSLNQKRVLFLLPRIVYGGAERVIVTLLRHLDRNRFKLTIAVIDTREAVYRSEIPNDVEFIDLGCRRVRYALPSIVALIWKRRPDIVFSTLGHLNLALAMLRPFMPSSPCYVARETTLVSHALKSHRQRILWDWMYRRFYDNHDLLICQSRAMMDDLTRNFGIPKDRTIVINNPVDVKRIRHLMVEGLPEAESKAETREKSQLTQLIASGRLVKEKGFDLLIEAFALLDTPNIRLTILGDGALRTSLEQLACARGVEKQVQFVGFQANPYAWYAQSDAFVLSSRYEGFPNVVLEALACRKPVIATPAPGGTQEVLEGIPGCIIAPAISAQALADAIGQWLASSHRPVSDKAVAPYRLSTIIARYEELLGSL